MGRTPTLRHVDPYKRRGSLYLALCRFSATKAGAWLSANVAWKVALVLLKLTMGRFSMAVPLDAALFESRGGRREDGTAASQRNAIFSRRRAGDDHRVVARMADEPRLVSQPSQASRCR